MYLYLYLTIWARVCLMLTVPFLTIGLYVLYLSWYYIINTAFVFQIICTVVNYCTCT